MENAINNNMEWLNSMDWTVILTYVAAIIVIWVLFKIFSWPIRTFVKILINSILGAALLFLVNYLGANVEAMNGFQLPITWWSALMIGVLGVPGIIILAVLTFI